MITKKVKPTSPGRRFQTYTASQDITHETPERRLLKPLKKSGGRNVHGRITIRRRGGGHKRHYRVIDFKREKTGIPAKVASIDTIPTDPRASPCCIMPMGTSAIFWHRLG
jgi:large subunit ribosomal protein L2